MEELNYPVRAERTAFSQTEELAETIVPLLNLTPTELVGGHHIGVSKILANTICPALVIP